MAKIDENSFFWRNIKRGSLETLGWNYTGWTNEGFLGMKGPNWKKTGFFGKALPGIGPLMLGIGVYQGYKENGVSGAIKEGASMWAFNVGFSAARDLLWNPLGAAAAGLAIAGTVTKGVNEYGKEKRKRIQGLEFAAVGADTIHSQGALTERQRAVNALNDSRINARIALGNEASLLHTRYR